MSKRYSKLFSLPENLYNEYCPVMICAGVLSKDNQTNKVFVQLRLQNIDTKYRNIIALRVAITSYGPAGNILGTEKEYQYLDLDVNRGMEFGGKSPIYLDDSTTRSYSVSILEVVFTEGNIWDEKNGEWVSLKQSTLEDSLGSAMAEQYRRDTFCDAKYEVLANGDLWLCACGALNAVGESNCCRCHNSKVELFKALDHTVLTQNFEEYTKRQCDALKKKKVKNKIISGICILLSVVVLTVGVIISKSIKKEKMVDAFIGYIYPNAYSDTYWGFIDEGTYLQIFTITDTKWIGQWKVVSVSGNTMRISMDCRGEFDVFFEKEGGNYKVVSMKSTGEPYRDWGKLEQIKKY